MKMSIDEAIEKLTARINCEQADIEQTCQHDCDNCVLLYLQGNAKESIAALVREKKRMRK